MVGVAVKVTLVPLQIALAGTAAMLTLGVTLAVTVSVMAVLVAVLAVWQALFAVMVQVITSPFTGE